MKRKIIHIDQEKCNGCGACAQACHEGAIAIIEGKARLIRDDYCDGLGSCLPACPVGAISFEEREAAAYDEEAVRAKNKNAPSREGGCPGSRIIAIQRKSIPQPEMQSAYAAESELRQWPVQIKLVPANAAFFNNANLLVAADCTAFAYAGFHQEFIKNHITLIACPKLDQVDYTEKLTEIIRNNSIKSVKVVRMQVPCCGGIENAVKQALINSGKMIPWQVVVISTDGKLLVD